MMGLVMMGSVMTGLIMMDGRYIASIELKDGWLHAAHNHSKCIVARLNFSVSCSRGFSADSTRQCLPDDISQLCAGANISLASKLLASGSKPMMRGKIGERGELMLSVHPFLSTPMAVTLVPVKGTVTGPINSDGRFAMSLTETGKYAFYIGSDNGPSCSLPALLKIECQSDYDEAGRGCKPKQDKSTVHLHVIMGISMGVVLALVTAMLLLLFSKDAARRRAKKVFLSFMGE